ncbi:putative delta-1-pyrroline-5-carboxylate dehydrogenase [Diplodia seriata]|uniref:Putative delta-1-pyrroline-5-carboxylate dehydrogenase n=1 Tax=Diplodia seriata TaxID=420778 RepID=A0A0G2DWU5_9PEZI|nr:putative delta-1-pyrroline-5-carboxylate dehydrogenase [Diplodia seriata]
MLGQGKNIWLYVAESAWPEFKTILQEQIAQLKVGSVEDYENFITPVIHKQAFDRLNKASKDEGYFVDPTVYRTSNPRHDIMSRELFGPILAVYVYPDSEWKQTLKALDTTLRYALTGSIYAKDPYALREAMTELKHAAGMLYLNTKCTGSVVAQ